MSTLAAWARSSQDTILTWGVDVPDELCAALISDTRPVVSEWLVRMLAAEQIATACLLMARRYAAIIGEHARDTTTIRRWAQHEDD